MAYSRSGTASSADLQYLHIASRRLDPCISPRHGLDSHTWHAIRNCKGVLASDVLLKVTQTINYCLRNFIFQQAGTYGVSALVY